MTRPHRGWGWRLAGLALLLAALGLLSVLLANVPRDAGTLAIFVYLLGVVVAMALMLVGGAMIVANGVDDRHG